MARKILLADDSVTAQNMGRKILADAGYEVIAVNNGSAALKKIAELKPDLVILDVYMPGYSGLEVCQRLKESSDSSRIPVLLTVGKLEPFKPEEAQRVRAEGFIVKPFEASELLLKVFDVIAELCDLGFERSDAIRTLRAIRIHTSRARLDSIPLRFRDRWRSREQVCVANLFLSGPPRQLHNQLRQPFYNRLYFGQVVKRMHAFAMGSKLT